MVPCGSVGNWKLCSWWSASIFYFLFNSLVFGEQFEFCFHSLEEPLHRGHSGSVGTPSSWAAGLEFGEQLRFCFKAAWWVCMSPGVLQRSLWNHTEIMSGVLWESVCGGDSKDPLQQKHFPAACWNSALFIVSSLTKGWSGTNIKKNTENSWQSIKKPYLGSEDGRK